MLNTLKKISPAIGAALIFTTIAGCPGGNAPNTTPGVGTDKASISGTVTKQDGSMADNATIVLIKKEGGADSDFQIQRSSNGNYAFTNVPAGNYRVAFVIQTQQERENKTPIAYDSAGKSGQYFGAITTRSFDYTGDNTKTYQVPSFNVGWVSSLMPNNTTASINGPVNFSWAPVGGSNVKYNVLIKDSNDNPFYKSDELSGTTFNWTTLKGNQGNYNGTEAKAGQYQYIVNAIFDTSNAPADSPVITAGNTANAKFTLQ